LPPDAPWFPESPREYMSKGIPSFNEAMAASVERTREVNGRFVIITQGRRNP